MLFRLLVDSRAYELPADLAAAHAIILVERAARVAADAKQAEAADAQAKQSSAEALIADLEIENLRRPLYGTRSKQAARLLDQLELELELEELEAAATEELAAETAARKNRRCIRLIASGPFARPSPTTSSESVWSFRSGTMSLLRVGATVEPSKLPRRWRTPTRFKVIDTVREKSVAGSARRLRSCRRRSMRRHGLYRDSVWPTSGP